MTISFLYTLDVNNLASEKSSESTSKSFQFKINILLKKFQGVINLVGVIRGYLNDMQWSTWTASNDEYQKYPHYRQKKLNNEQWYTARKAIDRSLSGDLLVYTTE